MTQKKDNYNITIGFSTTRQPISKIIRWFTGSSCTHTFIAFNDTCLKMRMVIQAEAWGFELRPWKRWKNDNILVAEFRPTGGPLDKALFYLAEQLGGKFDFQSAILTGLKYKFLRWFHAGLTLNPNYSPSKLMCSEAVIRFLSKGKYKSMKRLNPELTSPGDLLLTVLQSDEFKDIFLNKKFIYFDRKIKKEFSE